MVKRAKTAVSPLAKRAFRRMVPLGLRKRLALRIGRSSGIPNRYYWSMEVVRDLAERDPDAFHRFLWSNHLAYAETYEVDERFGGGSLHPSRRLLFSELERVMTQLGIAPEEVDSVLEVGSSLGYLLHHLEGAVFPDATVLDGIDIDGTAIESGSRHLERLGSRVRLLRGDMAELDRLVGDRTYDIVLCSGTLMYLNETAATEVVAAMVGRARRLVVLAGLADADRDNAELPRSGVRARDRSWIHNLDAMVEATGATVVHRRWDGPRSVEGNTIYFVFAEPAPSAASARRPTMELS